MPNRGVLTLAALGAALARDSGDGIPLLALRVADFERIAWRQGKTAARRLERTTTRVFLKAAREALRAGDLAAHDPGSDIFAVAMTAPARACSRPSAVDCRSAVERIAAALTMATNLRVQTGWTVVRDFGADAPLGFENERALERGSRERERYEFFSAVGHELRTPLTSIRGYLETLIDDGVDGETAQRFLRTARRETLRLSRLVDGMFEFSLLDLSAGALLGRTCDLDAQIDAGCEIVRPAAQARSVTAIRAGDSHAIVELDPDACLQLLVNLLENAVKYGRDGGRVEVSVRVEGLDAVICVDDDGPGIAPGARESIFGLRVRGAQAESRPGTGIGLAIVKMIAERAGGRVAVCDSPLGGARFEARLPRKADSSARAS